MEQPCVAKPQKENVKYCVACGTENAKRVKYCSECGGQEFVATCEEYEEKQRLKQEHALREAEAVRKAEEERKKAEAEAATLRAELERLKADTGKSKVSSVEDKNNKIYRYTKSAEQGDASAQCNLGFYYDKGQGVPKDYKKAVYWYTKAAEQGHAYAIEALKKLNRY